MKAMLFIAAATMSFINAAQTADAATYVRYDFLTQGSGYLYAGSGSGAIRNYSFSYVVPTVIGGSVFGNAAGTSITFLPYAPGFIYPNYATASATAAGFTITQGTIGSTIPFAGAFAATACYQQPQTTVAFPTSGFATDPSCSSIKYEEANSAFSRFYTGQVVELRVTAFEAASAQVGLVAVNSVVPESSTWIMMLVGFAALGGAMRYQRRNSRVSFVQGL